MSLDKLEGKVAVVTGAGGTLCSEMARSLAKNKMKVALLGRTKEKLLKVEHEIKEAGGSAISCSGDVTQLARVQEIRQDIHDKLGPAHILINGAGGNQMAAITTINEFDEQELDNRDPDFRGFFNLDMDSFSNVIQVNTMGSIIPCQVFGEDMARNKAGAIINIASMTSYRPLSRVSAYAIAKAGITNFTSWLAAYLAPVNVRVNAIAPGFFLNDRSRYRLLKREGGFTERGESIIRQTPMRRFGEAPELIGSMNWLIDEEASGFVTGITIPVDGGFLSCPGV